jgi:predicted nucleic acid-binding Zn finger protein
MGKSSEIDLLMSICKEGKRMGKLTGNHLIKLFETFGKRFAKAFEALEEKRIKKYVFKPSGKVVWIVVGKERDYLLMSQAEFCSCNDFYFRVLDRKIHLCYHLIAQKMAKNLEVYDYIEERDQLYDSLLKEWKKPTL